jgi:hypothetical protein
MAATTKDRETPAVHIERVLEEIPLKVNEVIPAGVIVCSDANGDGVNGSDTAGLIVQGRSAARADYAAGDRYVIVERGVFLFANNGNVVAASRGILLTVVDNQTVGLAADTANDVGAGYCEGIRSDGVLVSMLGGKIAAA